MIQFFNLLLPNARSSPGAGYPSKIPEDFAQTWNHVGGMLAIVGSDEVVIVVGNWWCLGVLGRHGLRCCRGAKPPSSSKCAKLFSGSAKWKLFLFLFRGGSLRRGWLVKQEVVARPCVQGVGKIKVLAGQQQ